MAVITGLLMPFAMGRRPASGCSPFPARSCALITGAPSGLGQAFAERLTADANDVIAVARWEDRLRALADRVRDAHGATTEVLVADLTAPEDLRRVEARIAAGPRWTLVNNAGFGGYRPFLQLDVDRAEELIRLQVLAVTRLASAALPAMVARGQGAVINVSSQLAFSAALPSPPMPPGRAVYAATKGLRQRLHPAAAQRAGRHGRPGAGPVPRRHAHGVLRADGHRHEPGAHPSN